MGLSLLDLPCLEMLELDPTADQTEPSAAAVPGLPSAQRVLLSGERVCAAVPLTTGEAAAALSGRADVVVCSV